MAKKISMMSEEVFRSRVNGYIKKAGLCIEPEVEFDPINRVYSARFPGEEFVFICAESGMNMSMKLHGALYPFPRTTCKASGFMV